MRSYLQNQKHYKNISKTFQKPIDRLIFMCYNMLCNGCGHGVKRSKIFFKSYNNTALCLCKNCAKKLAEEINEKYTGDKKMREYIMPNYETISAIQKRDLMELMNSSLLNAFSEQDYYDVLWVFNRIIERLKQQAE